MLMRQIDPARIKRILYIHYKPFGDVLCNTGVLPYIKERFPKAQLEYLVRTPYDQVLAGNEYIDELVVFSEGEGKKNKGIKYFRERLRLYGRIRRRGYDLVIDQMSGTGSSQIALLSKAPYRLGYAGKRHSFIYNIKALPGRQRYSGAMKFDLLKPLDIEEGPYRLHYAVTMASQEKIDVWLAENGIAPRSFVLVAPGSPAAYKQWRTENFAVVADEILKRTSFKVVLAGAPEERPDMTRMAQLMLQKPILTPPTTLNEAAALLNRARLLICNDVAVNHLSAATQTPSLAIFGRTDPVNWSPTSDPHHYYLQNPDGYASKDNSFGISATAAAAKALNILSELR